MPQVRKVSVGLFQHVCDVLKGMVVAAFLAAFLCWGHLVRIQLESGDLLIKKLLFLPLRRRMLVKLVHSMLAPEPVECIETWSTTSSS